MTTKRDFVRRYKAGEFGNAAPTWDTFEEYWESGYSGLVHFRNRVAGGPTWYNVRRSAAPHTWKLVTCRAGAQNFYVSAMAPSEHTAIQGEVQLANEHYELTYSRVNRAMREALATHTEYARGIIASLLLRYYLCPNSYEWLMTLLQRYSGHVVEFSTYDVEWGTLPGFNTIFWEVRRY